VPVTTVVSDDNKESKARTSSNKNDTVRLVALDTELKLKLDFQTLAYVNQTVNFSVVGSGIGENIINSLNYTWNFGDTDIATGKKSTHAYAYPGTYVVTLRANFARHNQVVRQEITVLPVTFSITKNEAGDIQIHNDAPYDVELSGFTIQGTKNLIFPPDTIIIPRGTITIKASKLGMINKAQTVNLFDQEKTLVAFTIGLPTKSTSETLALAKVSAYQIPPVLEINTLQMGDTELKTTSFNFVKPADKTSLVGNNGVVTEITSHKPSTLLSTPEALAAEGQPTSREIKETRSTKNSWAYFALIGLLFLGFVGLLLRPNDSTQKES
jgi:PKD repeat protein